MRARIRLLFGPLLAGLLLGLAPWEPAAAAASPCGELPAWLEERTLLFAKPRESARRVLVSVRLPELRRQGCQADGKPALSLEGAEPARLEERDERTGSLVRELELAGRLETADSGRFVVLEDKKARLTYRIAIDEGSRAAHVRIYREGRYLGRRPLLAIAQDGRAVAQER
jgi:hypothetical protein